jgi:hypothetical protein
MSDSIAAANSLLVSTIDSDIANISTDQFGLVFAGGIVSDSDDHYLERAVLLVRIIPCAHSRSFPCPYNINDTIRRS